MHFPTMFLVTSHGRCSRSNSYMDYDAVHHPVNLPDSDLDFQTKQMAFFTYASFDNQLVSCHCCVMSEASGLTLG